MGKTVESGEITFGRCYMLESEELWKAASELLRSQVSDGVWQSTFSQAFPVELTDSKFVLGLPNGIVRDKVDGRYRPLVQDAVAEAAGKEINIQFQLALPTLFDHTNEEPPLQAETTPNPSPVTIPPLPPMDIDSGPSTPFQPTAGVPQQPAASPISTSTAPIQPQPNQDLSRRYTFESFVIGPSNRFAHAAALSVAERPGGSYNPLFIYGSAGLGKTHILRAIEHFVNDVYTQLKVLYVSTETFLNEFVDSIKNSSGNDFKKRYRQIDVLLVDDIQFLSLIHI